MWSYNAVLNNRKDLKVENTIIAVDSCSEQVKEVIEKELSGSIYSDESYELEYDGKIYNVYQCDVVGMKTGNICFYRLAL